MLEKFRGKSAERAFEGFAKEAGFTVQPSPSIRSPYPVCDKSGETKKTITTPDFLLTHPRTGQTMYIEVTQSTGDWGSKGAQQRVVAAAKISNYMLITGIDLLALSQLDEYGKRDYLLSRCEWQYF